MFVIVFDGPSISFRRSIPSSDASLVNVHGTEGVGSDESSLRDLSFSKDVAPLKTTEDSDPAGVNRP